MAMHMHAGLGEVCTHVAAVLFFLETTVRTVTFQKSIPYLPVKEEGFTTGDRTFKLEEGEAEAQAEEFAASFIFFFLTLAEVKSMSYTGK